MGTTREGFTFTKPYFYLTGLQRSSKTKNITNITNGGDELNATSFSMINREDDPQWSDFVYWIISSTFYAEEHSIGQAEYIHMPLKISLFGPEFENMLQEAIKAVGNYGEMYARSVERLYPRNNTRNMLNSVPFGPQIFPLI